MTSNRIVTVFGATGTQGSSVVNALLSDGTFKVRGITRNTATERAQKLHKLGVELVIADLWDKDSIREAVKGSEGVFGVTNFYDPSIVGNNPKGEIQQGKNLIDAAKEARVKFFIWSSLPSTTKLSKGRFPNILHFDNKAAVEDYLNQSGLPGATLQTGWFAENVYSTSLKPASDGTSFVMPIPKYAPTATQEITWIERDLGACALTLFKNQDAPGVRGGTFQAVTARTTFPQFAKVIEKVLGKPVKFVSTPSSGMEELDDMFEFQSEIGMYPDAVVPDPRLVKLGVQFSTLEEFAESLKSHFL